MNEKPEALEVAADLRARIARHPSSDTTRTLLICDDAARCLEEQHAENERQKAKNKRLKADNNRLRKALEMVAGLPGFEPEQPYGKTILAALRREDKT